MAAGAVAKWRDLSLRTLSATILVPLVLAAVWAGGVWFTLTVALFGVAIAYEWTDIVHDRDPVQFVLHAAAAISGALLPVAAGIGAALVFLVALAGLSTLSGFIRRARGIWPFLGVAYVGLPAVALVVLRADPALGMKALFWLLAVVWATDIAAYFAGRTIGGPKLAPMISPNKTWAGALGAIIGSMLAGALAAYLLIGAILAPALLAMFLSVVAQAGDLFKSALKRQYGLKD